jgi:hypothetical protein
MFPYLFGEIRTNDVGRSEAENRKRKDNTMAERKMTKGYTMLHYTEN